MQGRVGVDLDRTVAVKGFVRPEMVEDVPVGLGLASQRGQVFDFESVEVLVLQRAEGALADPVLAGALGAGADVQQLGPGARKRAKAAPLNALPLSVTSLIRTISPVSGHRGSRWASGLPPSRSASAMASVTASMASAPVQVGAMCQPCSTEPPPSSRTSAVQEILTLTEG